MRDSPGNTAWKPEGDCGGGTPGILEFYLHPRLLARLVRNAGIEEDYTQMEKLIAEIKETVIAGKHNEIEMLVEKSLRQGLSADDLINNALIAAMDTVGSRFAKGDIFVPEMLVSAMTMKKGLEIVKPLLQESASQ